MRVISTTESRRYGSDCLIEEFVSLIEDNKLYNVILTTRVKGSYVDNDMVIGKPTEDFHEAIKAYKFAGGRMS